MKHKGEGLTQESEYKYNNTRFGSQRFVLYPAQFGYHMVFSYDLWDTADKDDCCGGCCTGKKRLSEQEEPIPMEWSLSLVTAMHSERKGAHVVGRTDTRLERGNNMWKFIPVWRSDMQPLAWYTFVSQKWNSFWSSSNTPAQETMADVVVQLEARKKLVERLYQFETVLEHASKLTLPVVTQLASSTLPVQSSASAGTAGRVPLAAATALPALNPNRLFRDVSASDAVYASYRPEIELTPSTAAEMSPSLLPNVVPHSARPEEESEEQHAPPVDVSAIASTSASESVSAAPVTFNDDIIRSIETCCESSLPNATPKLLSEFVCASVGLSPASSKTLDNLIRMLSLPVKKLKAPTSANGVEVRILQTHIRARIPVIYVVLEDTCSTHLRPNMR